MKLVRPDQLAQLAQRPADYQRLDSLRLSEPRIELVQRRLRALLEVVQVESGGEPIEIDGFRLRDAAHWTAPQGSPNAELWHISTACNMRCPFCYEEGDPEDGSVLNEPAGMVTLEEVDTRLRYADPESGTGLFRPLTYINEIFCNPQAIEIMERIRASMPADEVFTFVTNGTYLDEGTVERLAGLKPLFFNFSVNSLDPRIRRLILHDREPQTAIAAPELLQRHRIPYLGSLVCWPTIPWDDIEFTVRELDRQGCAVIRFSLSAFSRFLKRKKAPYDREAFWSEGRALARRLQRELDTPIKVEPFHYDRPSYEPHLVGAIKHSPAAAAGLRAGDVLTMVDGRPVATANQALTAIARAKRRGERRLALSYVPESGGSERRAVLDADGPTAYPYTEMQDFDGFAWGLVLVENLKFGYLETMRRIIERHGARTVLVCSSLLMRPVVAEMIAASGAFGDVDLRLEVPENRYFGGSIVLGDLLVVDDYVAFIEEYTATPAGRDVDLVLIPSSPFTLGGWQRDLTGRPWTEVQRRVKPAVELIPIRPLTG